MKKLVYPIALSFLLAVLLGGCTAMPHHEKKFLTLLSAGNAIEIPLSQLGSAKVLGLSGTSVFFADGSDMHIEPLLLSDLGYELDLHAFPKYVLGLEDPSNNGALQADEVADLLAARDMLLYEAGEAKDIIEFETGSGRGYAAIGEKRSVIFLINRKNQSAITQIYIKSMPRSAIMEIIEGAR